VKYRAGGPTLEQRAQRFWERERRDLEVYAGLTKRQRCQPKWQMRERQWRKAALLTLAAGGELPEALARMFPLPPEIRPLAPSPATRLLRKGLLSSGSVQDVPRRASGTPWGSAWGSAWSRSE
jgi:hypothetical protein